MYLGVFTLRETWVLIGVEGKVQRLQWRHMCTPRMFRAAKLTQSV